MMNPFVRCLLVSGIILLPACAPTASSWPQSVATPARVEVVRMDDAHLPQAPWVKRVALTQVSPLYLKQWRQAENRDGCAIVALPDNSQAQRAAARARAATFHGGWAVAYDLPNQRSAYGIAGAGVLVGDGSEVYRWPKQKTWAGGSRAGYGLEGGVGPQYLAYVWVAGQDCLYNVWSGLGEAHLLQLLDGLRQVEGAFVD